LNTWVFPPFGSHAWRSYLLSPETKDVGRHVDILEHVRMFSFDERHEQSFKVYVGQCTSIKPLSPLTNVFEQSRFSRWDGF
jgi:hypothetical protein